MSGNHEEVFAEITAGGAVEAGLSGKLWRDGRTVTTHRKKKSLQAVILLIYTEK